MASDRDIAYFSMEIALEPGMPTYGGGLGVLAGDTLRSGADLGVRMVAVSLLHREGYFHQRLDADGTQHEQPSAWSVDDFVHEMPARVSVALEGREVRLRSWQYDVRGLRGFIVPVYLLDADLPENAAGDRSLTHRLYAGDSSIRLRQQAILGIGGLRMLRALGHEGLERFHMNEGHSALLVLERLSERLARKGRGRPTPEDFAAVRRQCVFTTHTPVPAAFDRYPHELVERVLGAECSEHLRDTFACGEELNMTSLGLRASHFVNGVAKRHGEVSRKLFPRYSIDAITNGVHAATWTSSAFQQLFDRHVPGWREDNFSLRSALGIPTDEMMAAHRAAKRELFGWTNRVGNAGMDLDHLTLGFARRATAYKRPGLLFTDLDRLRGIAERIGPLQILFAGKAHPDDEAGKQLIRDVFAARDALRGSVKVAFIENYDLALAKLLVSGVDVWLNTPEPPLEASGTSGMKAAMNGVPSLSVLDGWWLEGCIEGITGWAIGPREEPPGYGRSADATALYDKLEQVVAPCFYGTDGRLADVMRHAIALNGAFFNTQRMVEEYVVKAYYS